MGWSEDAARNRVVWTKANADYTDEEARRKWAAEAITWGVWGVPESELRILGDVSGLDVVELGCGTAYFSAWLARAGVAPGHRPLDHRLLAVLDRVVDVPLAVDRVDRPLRVLAYRPRALVRPEPRVVVSRVLREVRRNPVGVAGVEGLVIGADVVD